MSLQIKFKTEDNQESVAYLRERDIKSIGFGTEKMPNQDFNEAEPETEENSRLKDVEYCKITFYETVEKEVPYESVSYGKDKQPKTVIKTKKELVNNFWAVFDKEQFPMLKAYAESMS
jgi:hypothetical protein